jgi:hypothetical protein
MWILLFCRRLDQQEVTIVLGHTGPCGRTSMYIMWSMCGGGVMYCWVEVGRGSRAVQAVSPLGIEHLVYGSNIS